jgi:hypothetical protein
LIGAGLAVLALPAAALAQSPTSGGYGGEGANVQGEVAGGGGGALPFTGLDLLVLTLAAAMLIVVGLTIRHVSRAKA